jgi:AcrR family transcriptional regulator
MKIRRQIADNTRIKIIKAALKLFAENGFSGTSTQAIAKAARVNETLIFHHFGNKAELWKKVKENVVNTIALETLDPSPSSLSIFLGTIIQQRLTAYQQEPHLLRLMQWQRLESKTPILAGGNILAPINWVTPIKFLQQRGKIRKDFSPEIIMTWLLASINALILDNMTSLREEKNRQEYIACLLEGFERALSVK